MSQESWFDTLESPNFTGTSLPTYSIVTPDMTSELLLVGISAVIDVRKTAENAAAECLGYNFSRTV